MTEMSCDICGRTLSDDDDYIHFNAMSSRDGRPVAGGRPGAPLPSGRVQSGPWRQHDVTVCGACLGDTHPDHWIAGYTRERDRLEQAAGEQAARDERKRLGLCLGQTLDDSSV